jgi:mono/diheme cytochrome c family protein/peroxiredoxin
MRLNLSWHGHSVKTGVLLIVASLAAGSIVSRALGGEVSRPPLHGVPGLDGKIVNLAAPEAGASVIVFYSSECPISNSYSPTLNEIAAQFPPPAVRMVGVCVDPDLSSADVSAHAKEFGLKFPVVHDRLGTLAMRLGAKVTPEAFVIDDQGDVRYHGRIDDQYAARRQRRANSTSHELLDAIGDVLAGRKVANPHVEAVGCPMPARPKEASTPTFSREVASILQKNCQQCHRLGQVGPFSLMTFEQAQKRADDIAAVVTERRMPPWKPEPGFGPKYRNDRSLTDVEIATLAAWADAGAPAGNPADLPPPAQFSETWALGTPDLVLEAAEDFAIPASGDDIYRCFVIPTDLTRDVDVAAIEYRPGNRSVVHHVICYVDTTGQARKRDDADPGQGYSCFSGPGVEIHGDLGGWAPGNEPNFLPDGVGRTLPRGADVVMQVHYHPSGKPETDRTQIGIYFSRKPIKQVLHWVGALNPGMKLPPSESRIEIKAEWTAPIDLRAFAVTPHMHLLGRDMALTLTFPDGRTEKLLKINDWDFNWQNTYYFETPLDVPKGTVLNVVSHYDNSESNPYNPNRPPKLVKWGEATTDEMCIGFLAVTKKDQDLTRPGETDDLQDVFKKQAQESRKQFERSRKQRSEAGKRESSR